jgi:hypothetical protein
MRERALGTAKQGYRFRAHRRSAQSQPERWPVRISRDRCIPRRCQANLRPAPVAWARADDARRQDARYGLLNGGSGDGRGGRRLRQARYPAPRAGATLLNTSR